MANKHHVMSKPNSSSNQDHFNLHLMLESILSENNNHDELSQNDILRIIMEKNEKSKVMFNLRLIMLILI